MKKWLMGCAAAVVVAHAATPVQVHGRLSVQGNKIVDQNGNAADLRGMSLFWSMWMDKYWKQSLVDWLVSDWKISVVRAPMGIEPEGGYLTDPDAQEALVRTVVDAAIRDGIYVVVDWHEENAVYHEGQAIDFFKRMATTYGKHPNVIYEIYNEPVGHGWGEIKNYATNVAKAIRQIDPKNLIIVGTPNYSSEIWSAAADPVAIDNVAYTFHFYAASHKQDYRDRVSGAMGKGIAVFVTEWGTCESNGNGTLDYGESKTWLQFMDDNHLSWANWSIADKDETCSALNGGAYTTGHWSPSQLRASGAFLREEIRKRNAWYDGVVVTVDTFSLPGSIDASKASKLEGPRLEADESGSGKHLAYIDDATAAEWTVHAGSDMTISVKLEAAGMNAGGSIRWLVDGAEVGTSTVAGTGGWQTWATRTGPSFPVESGVHVLRLEFSGAGTGLFNLRTLSATSVTNSVKRRETSPIRWRIQSDRLEVENASPGEFLLTDLSGRILSSTRTTGGPARLAVPDAGGVLLLRSTGDNTTISVTSGR